MEEVRSYWQVASITHFCTLFRKPFKIPQFEPEELEQAFIIDVPVCENQQQQNNLQFICNGNNNSSNSNSNDLENDTNDNYSNKEDEDEDEDNKSNNGSIDDQLDTTKRNQADTYSSSSGYLSSVDTNNRFQPPRNTSSYSSSLNYQTLENNYLTQPQPQLETKTDEDPQQDLHLLVKLAIALLKPHFNSKITLNNWENYLKRIVEANWVDLEHYPSPFRIPFVSPEGIELTKNLNFNDLPLSDKIDLFCALCDYRFWCEDASDAIKDYPIEELRLESIGKDQQGFEYYYFSGTRLFREDKELSQDLISRKKRIKELEFELIELEKSRIVKEQEEKKRAEIERAKEAREAARQAERKRKQDEEVAANDDNSESATKRKKRNSNITNLPPRTGLRERRSSAASNNHETKQQQKDQERTPARTTRSSLAKQNDASGQQTEPQSQRQSAQKVTRGSARSSKQDEQQLSDERPTPSKRNPSLELPRKSPEEECKEELERLKIKAEERQSSWSIACESLEDWESFVAKFEKTKSTNERYLYANLNEYILPQIRATYAKRAAEVRRKEKEMLLSLSTRRVSTRIISKKAQEEEEERRSQLRDIELQKKKAEAESRLRAELEREMRARKNRFVINGEASSTCSEEGEQQHQQDLAGRYNLRQQHDLLYDDPVHEFDGIIHPDKLSDFYEALELIVDTVRTSKHAWPFVDAVPENVPGYYDLIKEPMDLKKLRTKVEFRAYKSLIELEKDFQLLVNNCERFNGPKNVYTKMVYKLWKSFRKNVQLYLQRDLHMNEHETFIYPPQPPALPPPPLPEPKLALELQDVSLLHNLPEQQRQPSITLNSHQESIKIEDTARSDEPSQHFITDESRLEPPTIRAQEKTSHLVPIVHLPQQLQPVLTNSAKIPNQLTVMDDCIKSESLQAQPTESGLETIVEEIIYDTPDNEIYIWQDTIVQESQ